MSLANGQGRHGVDAATTGLSPSRCARVVSVGGIPRKENAQPIRKDVLV
jgi:hypothetical protein